MRNPLIPIGLVALVIFVLNVIAQLATPQPRAAWLQANCARILASPTTPGHHPTLVACQDYLLQLHLRRTIP